MTGAELADAMRRFASFIESQSKVTTLDFDLLPGATLKVRSAGAKRQARFRQRRNADVTPDDVTNGVTKSVTKSVTSRRQAEPPLPHTPSPHSHPLVNTEDPEGSPRAHESEHDHSHNTSRNASVTPNVTRKVTPEVTPNVTHESDTETVCPLDLLERAEKHGVLLDLAKGLKVDVERVRLSAEEFVSYWTIGAGIGKRYSSWPRKLREHIRRSAQQGRLPEVARASSEPEVDPPMHPKAKARLEQLNATRRAELQAERARLEAAGEKLPERDIQSLTGGIGG